MNHQRKIDVNRTEKLEPYLDWLYQKNGFEVERVYDKQRQLEGIDVIASLDGDKQILIDEKAAISAWNRNLGTFALEVSTNNNIGHTGWLYNKDLKTTHYALVYVRAEDENLSKLTNLEVLMINKAKLHDYLKKQKLGSPSHLKYLVNARGTFNNKKKYYCISKDLKLVKSYDKIERPVALIVNKDILKELSDKVLFINERTLRNIDKHSLNKPLGINDLSNALYRETGGLIRLKEKEDVLVLSSNTHLSHSICIRVKDKNNLNHVSDCISYKLSKSGVLESKQRTAEVVNIMNKVFNQLNIKPLKIYDIHKLRKENGKNKAKKKAHRDNSLVWR